MVASLPVFYHTFRLRAKHIDMFILQWTFLTATIEKAENKHESHSFEE